MYIYLKVLIQKSGSLQQFILYVYLDWIGNKTQFFKVYLN